MAVSSQFEEPKGNRALLWGLGAVGLVLLLTAIWFVYSSLNGVHGVTVDAPTPQMVSMLPPPPPPPPPPPEKVPPKPPEPSDAPKPTPSEPAAPKADAPAPMTQNAPAQAGSDSYGLQAGSGGGLGSPGGTGTCLGPNCGGAPAGGMSDGFYTRSLASALQQRVQSDKRVSRDVFQADFAIWISADGRVTRAEIIKSSRDDRRDQVLREVILGATGLQPPPATFKFPRRITVSGKKAI